MSESFAYGASEDPDRNDYFSKLRIQSSQRMQRLLDRSVPFAFHRWLAWVFLALMYTLRAYFVHGYYIVTYGLGIYNLNLMIGFLSPARDPSLSASEGPTLPSSNNEEYRPFVRKLPEFKFWVKSAKSLLVSFSMTFFPVFDVPVFWPILLMYFIMLFTMTMKQQLRHMIKHKYVPFSWGKQTYGKGSGGGKEMSGGSD
ncbi:unnamed protein product [Bathycoccus prasinos]|uniref:Protein RER1 n=1 Tax=Bathycoccus prasinos TaxID=41875 RepID=K8ELN2_9CHLO|nr:predicted protein [Bathycoccus prasinos]CCO19162.1 predicted protein [Bathycoccus prasinos]|mmetsp:Transcript_6001/g.18857  ORF Transcript_6001/g.18857 Transcript_6001/m.18857 type:complete len:199 (+) Transcript_6001:131-727(+)|eukprot:XP_007510047.1 predicted protein [Bathycoccus prasinos]